jgi:hypothetical protein
MNWKKYPFLTKDGSAPNVDITLAGVKYTLTPADYIINSGSLCLLGMVGIDIPAPAGKSPHIFIVMHKSVSVWNTRAKKTWQHSTKKEHNT